LTALIDARTLPDKTDLACDIAIVGGGPAGISLALALAGTRLKVLLLESGGASLDSTIQKMYAGAETGVKYTPLDQGRLRFLGGSSNHWGGWCRPLDAIDFEKRDWVAHSGWPFPRSTIAPYFARAQELCEAGAWTYDKLVDPQQGPLLPLGGGGLYTSWFQFSKTRDNILPTYFGTRYADELKKAANVTPYTNINVTGVRLAANGQSVERLDAATLTGKHFTVKPRLVVLAAGAIETARLMLASNDVVKPGVGNQNDLVGRYFADHPVPRDVATLVAFNGALAACYGTNVTLQNGAVMRVALSPTAAFCESHNVVGSLTTIEQATELDETGKAAVITTAIALGVNASNAKTYTVGCGMELEPDPDRRLTLTGDTDALGMPRLKLDMRISDQDLARYRRTLEELGRQLLASKAGMLRISYSHREEWLKAMDWGNHHLGTTRMSEDARSGVVNADSQVHGVGNLFVAGSSVFPTYGSSNPTLNLIALTLRLADHLKKVAA
jgi:choline dehydrogenase-like flavoprotein